MNDLYFEILLQKSKEETKPLRMSERENHSTGDVRSFSLIGENERTSYPISELENLPPINNDLLKAAVLHQIKMQAGLGTSVVRDDLIFKYQGRSNLGSKSTDLFYSHEGEYFSIAELQIIQACKSEDYQCLQKVVYQDLVNEETFEAINQLYSNENIKKLLSTSEKVILKSPIFQKKMPTLDSNGNLTEKRKAPAGHGFIGFHQILEALNNESENEISCIGNGEDLNSGANLKIISAMIENNWPVVMVTTTKTEKDKKGGQLGVVEIQGVEYLTIIEKAQAEQSGQLELFESLGLKDGDSPGLFNTNVVYFNKKALKNRLNELGMDENQILLGIAPDVIKNQKSQNGEIFTQIESALGSVVLKLDALLRRRPEKERFRL